MAEFLAFLGLVFAVAAVVGAVCAGAAFLLRRAVDLSPRDAALPSHYSGALRAGSKPSPGHCSECGTNNDPGRAICENCDARLLARRPRRRKRDVNSFLKE